MTAFQSECLFQLLYKWNILECCLLFHLYKPEVVFLGVHDHLSDCLKNGMLLYKTVSLAQEIHKIVSKRESKIPLNRSCFAATCLVELEPRGYTRLIISYKVYR